MRRLSNALCALWYHPQSPPHQLESLPLEHTGPKCVLYIMADSSKVGELITNPELQTYVFYNEMPLAETLPRDNVVIEVRVSHSGRLKLKNEPQGSNAFTCTQDQAGFLLADLVFARILVPTKNHSFNPCNISDYLHLSQLRQQLFDALGVR